MGVWADSAYRSAEIEAALKKKGLRSRIHRKSSRNKPLSEREKQGNKTRSSVRARVEHVFGAQSNDMGGTLLRSVGLARAKARIGLKNLARRLVQLDRSPRRCDNTPSRRSPGHGLEAEIVQLERGKLPEIPVPAWPQTATARLTNHPLSNREFLEVPPSGFLVNRHSTRSVISRPASISARRSSHVFCKFSHSMPVRGTTVQ